MTTDSNNPQDGQKDGQSRPLNEPLTPAALIRLASDGELTEAQRQALDAHLAANPDAQSRIDFEAELRSSCGRVMDVAELRCPDALRAKVEAIAAAARLESEAEVQSSPEPSPQVDDEALRVGLSERADGLRGESTRDQGFWASGGMQRVIGALAAAVVLVASAAFLVQMSQNSSNPVASSEGMIQRASFVAGEHRECGVNPAKLVKFTVLELDQAPGVLSEVLGTVPTIPDFEAAGFVFDGAGECRLPGGGRSVHLRMIAPTVDGQPGVRVSLFMQSGDRRTVQMQPGKAYELSLPDHAVDGPSSTYTPTVYAWLVDDIGYYLVAEQQLPCQMLAESIGLEIVPCR